MTTIGIVSPGAMGSALGAALRRGGERVVTTVAGRTARTARLAERAELELLPDLASVARESDVVLSVVPPELAEAVAREVIGSAAATGSAPLYADLNAISPETALRIEELAAAQGIDVVDGSISGPPPWQPGTRVYLSGPRAPELAELRWAVDAIVVGDVVGTASAVKMSTASVYKGTTALLAQALLAAEANGVLEHVLEDLRDGAPELVRNVERRLALGAVKSGRYVGEMREIARTQAAAELTPALFDGIADVYVGLSSSPLAALDPEDVRSETPLTEVLRALRRPHERRPRVRD
jgi:3-hydroxyisobutyrate dehydrogenase-like beta-hydroxyacid dehydrogenase